MRERWWRQPRRITLALVAALLAGALAGCATPASGAQTGATSSPTTSSTATSSVTATATATAAPAPTATHTASTTTCQPNQLTLTIHSSQGAAGHIGQQAQFTNHSNSACTLYGFPGAQMLDAQHNPMTTHALWETSAYMFSNQFKQTVHLAPGGSAYFAVTWSDVPSGSATSCPVSAYLAVTPPNDFSVLTVADQIGACDGNLEISPVEPTAFMGG